MAGASPVAAARIEWVVQMTDAGSNHQQPVVTTYTVSADLTRISGPEETTLIDYRGRRIYRIGPPGATCRSYPFGRPHADLPAASFTVIASKTAPDRRRISFGMGQALAQTAVTAALQFWGQRFPFVTAEYRISRAYPGVVELIAIAGKHRRVFQQYPLLRRIDPVGLLDLLEGFPVSESNSSPTGRTIVSVHTPPRVAADSGSSPLPGNCIESQ